MNEVFRPESKTVEQAVQPVTRELFFQLARQKFAYSFGLSKSVEECIENIIAENTIAIEATEQADAIKSALRGCVNFTDKVLFADAVANALEPVLNNEFEHLGELKVFGGRERILVNESLSYDIQGDSLRIHIFTGGLGRLNRYVEGFPTIAEILKEHPEVTTVDAISWIVVKHPDILERKLGFTVQREADGKPTAQVFGDEEVGHAFMDREDFLKKYLKQ